MSRPPRDRLLPYYVNRLGRFFFLLGLIAATVLFPGAVAAAPAPGTVIRSQASLNYIDPVQYAGRDLYSNIVLAVVTGSPGLDLQADRSAAVTAGSWFVFPHSLTNTGNDTGAYTLTPSVVTGGDFAASQLALVIDLNGNGIVDAGEQSLPFSACAATLTAGQTLHFLIIGQVPSNPGAGLPAVPRARFRIEASVAGSSATAANTDTLTLGTGELQFFKSVSTPVAARGATADYTLSGTNNFATALAPVAITIDGAADNRVIVRDRLPNNIEFVSFGVTTPATPLYHRAGDPLHTYTTAPQGSLRQVDAVAFAFGALAAGDSFSVGFRVRVGANATGSLINTAHIYSLQGSVPLVTASNPATITVPPRTPAIEYFNSGYTRTVPAASLGSNLHVQVDAGDCTTRPYPPNPTLRMVTIVITSALTGDSEIFDAIETAFNTGTYRIHTGPADINEFIPTENAAVHGVTLGDFILQTLPKDQLTATIEDCGGVVVRTRIFIDPAGVVYDSRTNVPVAGARVTLLQSTDGGASFHEAAGLLDEDGNPVASTQITAANGEFNYPLVDPALYRLSVVPPADYSFPSVIPAGAQPAGRRIQTGSFGNSFPVNLVTGAVFLDVPLDTSVGAGLLLTKKGSRDVAEIGDSVIYTLTLANNSGAPFNFTFIDDRLPAGFRYEPGTTRRDGARVSDPVGGVGPSLRFPVGTLPDTGTVTFTYRARLTPGAEKGTGINTAQATSYGPPVLVSNRATHQVRVEAGFLDPKAVIIGTVFVDANANDIQDAGEPGVPGVRVILEDGTRAITDGDGQYSLYGQRAITHVLKLDRHTLPAGATLGGNSPRFAGDPGSRFVDLKNYELHKANFLVIKPTPELYAAIEERRKQADDWKPEIASALATTFNGDGTRTLVSDVMGRQASGVIGAGANVPPSFKTVLPDGTLTAGNSSLPPGPVARVPLQDLEKLVAGLTGDEPGFIDLKDGDTLPAAQATIRIKGQLEARLALLVNGRPAPESRIGKNVRQPSPAIQALEYIALPLAPGANTLEIVQTDLFGNERGRKAITVTAPDQLARFKVTFSTPAPLADGRTPVEVTVTAVDAHDVPVTASMPLTLETTLGRWDAEDVNPREPGIQVVFQGGKGVYRLVPPLEPGEARIVISSGAMKADERLAFLPELRPMIASGIIEGRFALNKISASQLVPVTPSDAFEDSLREMAGIGPDGNASGRAAFYLKGKIKGDVLLTIAYDSDKRDDVTLFRDIDPDAFYPVYGDSSIKGYDAQSTGKLYVRIDKNRSYALLGDYNTRAETEVRQLGDYNRSVNGARVEHENSRFKGGLWASDASTDQVIREFPANGTSGPFATYASGEGLLNSEVVEIIVRDRNQTSVILSRTPLARNTDYEFEPFSGRLLLRRPLPSVDANFNPQSLRITFEVETNGPRFWVYGGDAQFKVHERIEVGGSFARDENPVDPYDLQSANVTLKLFEGTYLIGEGARSETITDGVGYAKRVELRHKSAKTEARVFYGETGTAFINPSSQLNSGRVEGGAKVTRELAARTDLITEAVYTEDQVGSGTRQGVRVDVAHTLPNQVKVTVGARVSEETTAPAGGTASPSPVTPIDVRSARVRVDTPVPNLPLAAVFAEYEQDVVVADQRLVAAGGTYQVSTKTRLYGRHEFISTLGSPFELNSSQQNNRTVFGVETEYMPDAHFFNEYRVQNSIDAPQSEASTGLRNGWQVADGLRLNTTLERVTPFDGLSTSEATAVTGAIDYTAPKDWKASARLEGRWADTNDTYLNTLGYARKLNDEWTALARTIVNVQLNDDAASPDLYQGRILAGLAWRQSAEDIWNALIRYEYKYEEGSTTLGATDMQRDVHVLATSVNYQPDRQWIFSGHYAAKFVHENYDNEPGGDYFAHLLAGRVLFEITSKWDAGLNIAALFSDSIRNMQYAIGPEIGYRIKKNVRIGLGYNFIGFDDRDFDTAATSHGLFLSLRIKFDENLLKWATFKASDAP